MIHHRLNSRCTKSKRMIMGWILVLIMVVEIMISETIASITLTTKTKTSMISMMDSMQVEEEAVVSPLCSIMSSKRQIRLTRCSINRSLWLKKRKLKNNNLIVNLNHYYMKILKNQR